MTSQLFTPFVLRDLTLKNRIVIAPMCTYSATDGFASDWHLAHLGKFALGGAAALLCSALAIGRGHVAEVSPRHVDHCAQECLVHRLERCEFGFGQKAGQSHIAVGRKRGAVVLGQRVVHR